VYVDPFPPAGVLPVSEAVDPEQIVCAPDTVLAVTGAVTTTLIWVLGLIQVVAALLSAT
jgi:hypothetical protein